MSTYPRSGPASRAVALDLMLRTFMNSAEFHASNPRIWENIAKLVPGTTPQQCAQRWEELRMSHSSVAGDFSGLTATGRPISSHGKKQQMSKIVRSIFNQNPSTTSGSGLTNGHSSMSEANVGGYPHQEQRPHSVMGNYTVTERQKSMPEISLSHSNLNARTGGKFVANFCQTVLNSSGSGDIDNSMGVAKSTSAGMARSRSNSATSVRKNLQEGQPQDTCRRDGAQIGIDSESSSNITMDGSTSHLGDSTGENGHNMVIHVCDEAKKLKRDFTCPRDILVREMHYFAEYLSADAQLWDEVDISVHCDVPVFDWLMRYTKQGMLEGPCGEKLSEHQAAPTLEVTNAVSILISSEFLKMDKLVEECLNFCHDNISTVISSPCNMACINDKLLVSLATKFTPLEVEKIADKKDKIKSKLFLYQLDQLFNPTYSTPECPANAATLFKCKHCNRLLTAQQQDILPCIAQRLSVNRLGGIVYSHERNSSWDVNTHFRSLQQQEGLTPRDIYWRLWGIVNLLKCEQCHCTFQCCDLPMCAYHPQMAVALCGGEEKDKGASVYMCCYKKTTGFMAMPHVQNGCVYRDHVVALPEPTTTTPDYTDQLYSTLLNLRETVCSDRLLNPASLSNSTTSTPTKRSDLQNTHNDYSEISCLLQNEQGKVRYCQAQALGDVPSTISTKSSTDSVQNVHSSSSTVSTNSRQQSVMPLSSRQLSYDCSDLEEDDDELMDADKRLHTQASVGNTAARLKKKGHHIKQKHSKQEIQGPSQPVEWIWDKTSKKWNQDMQRESGKNNRPSQPVEWIWDNRKSKRWNQDMQRESDERRQSKLEIQLSQMSASTPAASSSKNKEVCTYAGGIYSRLETQFRVQQAARAMALQNAQVLRSQGSGRRR